MKKNILILFVKYYFLKFKGIIINYRLKSMFHFTLKLFSKIGIVLNKFKNIFVKYKNLINNINVLETKLYGKLIILVNIIHKSSIFILFAESIKLLKAVFSVFVHFIIFVIYVIWIFVFSCGLVIAGYIKFSFELGYFYDPKYNWTPENYWEFLVKFLKYLRKNFFNAIFVKFLLKKTFYFIKKIVINSKNIFIHAVNMLNREIIKNYKITSVIVGICLFWELKFMFFYKSILNNLYIFKILILKKKKIKLATKRYIFFKFFRPLLTIIRKRNKFISIPIKWNLERKSLKFLFNTFFFKFKRKKSYLKLKQGLIKFQKLISYTKWAKKRMVRKRVYSTQKRFLYICLKLLKKKKNIKFGVLRVIYIKNLWIYSFYIKNYFFTLIFSLFNILNSYIHIEYLKLSFKLMFSIVFNL